MAASKAQRIQQYVRELDRNDRYLVMLHFVDELTCLEIGALLGLSAHRVEGRLEQLRQQLFLLINTPLHQPPPSKAAA